MLSRSGTDKVGLDNRGYSRQTAIVMIRSVQFIMLVSSIGLL